MKSQRLLHRRFYTQTLLHTKAFTNRSFDTQTLLHIDAFTHKHFHTEAFTHTSFHTQRLLHTNTFTHSDRTRTGVIPAARDFLQATDFLYIYIYTLPFSKLPPKYSHNLTYVSAFFSHQRRKIKAPKSDLANLA